MGELVHPKWDKSPFLTVLAYIYVQQWILLLHVDQIMTGSNY